MLNGIAFIGGIHGVGKSTACKNICAETGLKYLSASEVLKWKEINNDEANKTVSNINLSQNRLIKGLNSIFTLNHKYLLDGHYCLLNSAKTIERVPLDTFKKINPFSINLVVSDVAKIKTRLEARDNQIYDADLLNEFQKNEISYAKELSEILGVELNIGTVENISQFINALKRSMK